jgi:hypothetical protein
MPALYPVALERSAEFRSVHPDKPQVDFVHDRRAENMHVAQRVLHVPLGLDGVMKTCVSAWPGPTSSG